MSTARAPLSDDLLARVRRGERIELPEEGAAVIPLEDLWLLEEMEDAEDVRAAEEALAEGGEPIPLENLKAELGIE